ncbi:MAG: hypothetical protein ACOCU4_00890 [Alkalispirochaeta sp.]
MEILINDVPISFELEQEVTAGEVMDSLSRWLTSNGHTVNGIILNGTPVNDLPQWKIQDITSVERLEIQAASLHQSEIDQLETIINYTDLLRRVAQEGTLEQVSAVLDELPHISQAIHRLVPDLSGFLAQSATAAAEAAFTDESRGKLSDRAAEVTKILQQRQRELLEPEHELRGTVTALQQILPSFEEIPTQLQSGHEREALESVARFAELTRRLLRILPVASAARPELSTIEVEGRPFSEDVTELNQLFLELEEAFENSDMILIGDVMEYELLPRLTALTTAIEGTLDTPA